MHNIHYINGKIKRKNKILAYYFGIMYNYTKFLALLRYKKRVK